MSNVHFFSRFRALICLSGFIALTAWGNVAQAADTSTVASTAASAAVVKQTSEATLNGQVPKKVVPTATGTIAVKGGDRQYPAGTIPIPPKPKKEELEAAGAIKAKAAQP